MFFFSFIILTLAKRLERRKSQSFSKLIILVLYFTSSGLCRDVNLQIVNYAFLSVYLVEYLLRIIVDKRDYVPGSLWGFIDTFIMLIGAVTIVTNVLTADRPLKGELNCFAFLSPSIIVTNVLTADWSIKGNLKCFAWLFLTIVTNVLTADRPIDGNCWFHF